jgi:hypothetical protein
MKCFLKSPCHSVYFSESVLIIDLKGMIIQLVTGRFSSGLPFGLFKGQICQIWPFMKLFARNKMVWPFGHFLAFFEC